MMHMKRYSLLLFVALLLLPVRAAAQFPGMPRVNRDSLNALTAATKMLVPMKADLMSDYGLSMLDKFCADMQDLNPGVHIDYIFFNVYEKSTVSEAIEADVREKYGDRVLSTVVRKNVDVSKAAFSYTDIVSYDKDAGIPAE